MRWGHKVHTTHTHVNSQLRNIEIKWWWFSFSLRICCRLWFEISLSILIECFDIGSPRVWVSGFCTRSPSISRLSPEIYLRVPQSLVSQFTHKTGAGQMYETARRWNRKLLAHSIYLFTEAFKYQKSNEARVYSEHTSSERHKYLVLFLLVIQLYIGHEWNG